MADFDQTFPPLLAELLGIEIDYEEDEIDFEPYQEFLPAEENATWIQAWTGNKDLTGAEYRIFGQDGSGGYAAFWLARKGKPVLDQPIVFFGSEGELGLVATDFADFAWLMAAGIGPYEAVSYGAADSEPQDEFTKFAQKHVPKAKKSAAQVLERAQAAFPDFVKNVKSLCR